MLRVITLRDIPHGRFQLNLAQTSLFSCLLPLVSHPRHVMVASPQHDALTRVSVHVPAVATVRRTCRQCEG